MFSKTIQSAVLLVAAASIAFGADDGRDADRAAIRAHIDRIFQAFIHKDAAELRATHAQNWLGYLEGSTRAIHNASVARMCFPPEMMVRVTGSTASGRSSMNFPTAA